MVRLSWLTLSLLISLPLQAQELPGSERRQELGELLIQDCGSCHGLTLRGGLGPDLSAASLRGKSVEYLSRVILDGRPGTAMPAWRPLLSAAEARWLAEMLIAGQSTGSGAL